MAKQEDALVKVLGILAKAEAVWEQRLVADKAEKQVATTLVVTKQHLVKGAADGLPETKEDSALAIHRFVTQPATVNTEVGLTINIGNYESVRVSVGVCVPCYKEEIDDAYAWAKEFVEKKVKEEAAEVRAAATATKTANHPF